MINDAQKEVKILLEKAHSDRIRRIENAKTESREILKKKMEEAKDTSKYEIIVKKAEDEADLLRNKIKNNIPKVAKQMTDFILKLGIVE